MKKDLLDVLERIRDALDELLLGAPRDQMADLAASRDRVSGMIQEIIELDYRGTAEGMDQATQDLGALQAELAAAQRQEDKVKTGLAIAGKVATIVAGVVGAIG